MPDHRRTPHGRDAVRGFLVALAICIPVWSMAGIIGFISVRIVARWLAPYL